MLPTIDISLIGVLLAVWHVVVIIWDIFCKGFNWLIQHAIAVVVGSKFWAVAFFLSLFIVIVSIGASVLNAFLTFVGQLVYTAMPSQLQDSMRLFSSLIPFGPISELISYFGSAFAAYQVLDVTQMGFSRVWNLFRGLQRSWKM